MLGPVVREEERARVDDRVDDRVDEERARGVEPVQILEDDDGRLAAAPRPDEASDDVE